MIPATSKTGAGQEANLGAQQDRLAAVLHDQLEYLIAYQEQDRERFERVKKILLEVFA